MKKYLIDENLLDDLSYPAQYLDNDYHLFMDEYKKQNPKLGIQDLYNKVMNEVPLLKESKEALDKIFNFQILSDIEEEKKDPISYKKKTRIDLVEKYIPNEKDQDFVLKNYFGIDSNDVAKYSDTRGKKDYSNKEKLKYYQKRVDDKKLSPGQRNYAKVRIQALKSL